VRRQAGGLNLLMVKLRQDATFRGMAYG